MQAFVGGTGVGVFPNINDERGRIWVEYGVGNQPAFVLIGADGSTERYGSLSEEKLQAEVDSVFG